MIGMTAFAILCGIAAVLPRELSNLLIGLVWIMAAGWLTIGLVFARGEKQAFCIGAAIVFTSMWTTLGGRFFSGAHDTFLLLFGGFTNRVPIWFDVLCLAAASIANGYLCIRARRYFERHASD